MQKHHPSISGEEAKSNQSMPGEPDIVMVPLESLKVVQEQLDKLTSAMHHLSIRAVPLYKDFEDAEPWCD